MKVSDRDQNVNKVRIIGCVLMNDFLIRKWFTCQFDHIPMFAAGEGQVNFHQGARWRSASNTLGAGDS